MKGKLLLLGMSCLLIAALLLTACGGGGLEAETPDARQLREGGSKLVIGDTYERADFEPFVVTVSDIFSTKTYQVYDNEGKIIEGEAATGKIYYLITASIKNLDSVPRDNEGAPRFALIDSTGKEYRNMESTQTMGGSITTSVDKEIIESRMPFLGFLDQNVEISGEVIFTVPEDVTITMIAYQQQYPHRNIVEWSVE